MTTVAKTVLTARSTPQEIAAVIEEGKAAAEAKYAELIAQEGSDGGTCNFDCVYITIPRVRRDKMKKAAELAGVRVDTHYRGYPGAWMIYLRSFGQADRKSKCNEAARDAMRDAGADARMYYAAD